MPTDFVDRRFGYIERRKSHAIWLTNPHRHRGFPTSFVLVFDGLGGQERGGDGGGGSASSYMDDRPERRQNP
jgi:hypothetical protein